MLPLASTGSHLATLLECFATGTYFTIVVFCVLANSICQLPGLKVQGDLFEIDTKWILRHPRYTQIGAFVFGPSVVQENKTAPMEFKAKKKRKYNKLSGVKWELIGQQTSNFPDQ